MADTRLGGRGCCSRGWSELLAGIPLPRGVAWILAIQPPPRPAAERRGICPPAWREECTAWPFRRPGTTGGPLGGRHAGQGPNTVLCGQRTVSPRLGACAYSSRCGVWCRILSCRRSFHAACAADGRAGGASVVGGSGNTHRRHLAETAPENGAGQTERLEGSARSSRAQPGCFTVRPRPSGSWRPNAVRRRFDRSQKGTQGCNGRHFYPRRAGASGLLGFPSAAGVAHTSWQRCDDCADGTGRRSGRVAPDCCRAGLVTLVPVKANRRLLAGGGDRWCRANANTKNKQTTTTTKTKQNKTHTQHKTQRACGH